ncbi:hypothetical protein [Corynebacterium coyleae]|uniref:hypothetical protein n=1 Tax=Corynebacterium coyleae TaxID=53374 RepID=UPI002551B574|nr:hypothetical protein [Corynebacterium coyleae]MDK8242535.1 hypothetical protein [Corynebacterium coyleae]
MRDEQERLARQWAESKLAMPTGHLDADVIAAANHILATTKEPTMADVEWDHDKHYLAGAVDAYGSEVIMHSRVDDCEIATIRPGDETHGGRNWDTDLIPNGKRYELREITEPEHPVEPSTKTMDEYSPEEQADMIGMWAEYRAGDVASDFVIIEEGVNRAGRVPCYNPEAPEPSAWAPDPDELTPRFDLPRVWGKDGEPCEVTVSSGENVAPDQPDHPEFLETVEDYKNAPQGTIVALADSPPWSKTPSGGWRQAGDYRTSPEMVGVKRKMLRWGWGE